MTGQILMVEVLALDASTGSRFGDNAYLPFRGIGPQVFPVIHASESKEPILKAMSIKILAEDPELRTEKRKR